MTIFKHWLFNFHLIFCSSFFFFSLNGVGNIKISNIMLDSSSSFIIIVFFFSPSFDGHFSVIVERMVPKIRWKNNLIWKVNYRSRLKRENKTCNYPLSTQWEAKQQPQTGDTMMVSSWQVMKPRYKLNNTTITRSHITVCSTDAQNLWKFIFLNFSWVTSRFTGG